MPTFLQSNSQGTPQGLGDLSVSGYRGPNNVNTIGRGAVDFGGFPGAAGFPMGGMPTGMPQQPLMQGQPGIQGPIQGPANILGMMQPQGMPVQPMQSVPPMGVSPGMRPTMMNQGY
jgi:hypothetical protein